jgi:hypothetical protein
MDNVGLGSVGCNTLVYVIHKQNAQVLCMDIIVKPQPYTNEQIQMLPSLAAKYGMEIKTRLNASIGSAALFRIIFISVTSFTTNLRVKWILLR